MRGGKKIGVCAFACILTPSPLGHSPHIPCRNTGGEVEMYSSFAFAPILYRIPRHAAGYGRGRGGLPLSLPLTGIIYPLRPAATSPIFCWAKHPVMLRETVGEEENTPQSSEGIKRLKVILSILSLCSSQMRYGECSQGEGAESII